MGKAPKIRKMQPQDGLFPPLGNGPDRLAVACAGFAKRDVSSERACRPTVESKFFQARAINEIKQW